MKINLVICPYRDAYFFHEFGAAVRDLQFINTLSRIEQVDRITVINRPVSILERLLLKKPFSKEMYGRKITTLDSTSSDLFGAIKGRSWAADVYPSVINKLLRERKSESHLNVFLDFLPIGMFSSQNLDGWTYWYDFIDNFTKHNRFTNKEKALVKSKYNFVANNANYVTGVSDTCINSNGPYKADSKSALSNKIFELSSTQISKAQTVDESNQFEFGFIGFVTDKLDLGFIERIAQNHTVAIFGQVMDKNIGQRLRELKNVKTFGKFSYKDIPKICRQFKVGLLPYLAEKSHDGSPLKLYEYMKFNIPCLTSIDYEITAHKFIRNYNTTSCLAIDIEEMLAVSGNELISESIKDEWKLVNNLQNVIDELLVLNENKK